MNICLVTTYVIKLAFAQTTKSQYIKEIKNTGILKVSVESTSASYCLEDAILLKLRN